MTPSKLFGVALREYRTKKGLSQDELAHITGLDRTFISLLERGLRQPSLTTLVQLGAGLGMSASELVAHVERQLRRNGKARP